VIARNFLWLSVAQAAILVVGLFAGIYARRVLGPVAIGQYSWCVAVLTYFFLLANPKIGVIALRDVARQPGLAARRFSQILAVELSLALVAFSLVCMLAAIGLRGPTISHLLILSAIALLFVPLDITWLLQAHDRMAPPAICQVVVKILTLPALVLFVREPADVTRYVWLAYPFQLGAIAYLCWYARRHRLLGWTEVRPTFSGGWPLIKEAVPLGVSQGATNLYGNFDAILLGFLSSDRIVGIYSTAYSLMMIPWFLSAALTQAYFPRLSRLHDNERQSAILTSDFLTFHVWLGISLAALGWAFGRHVIVFLYGQGFAESGPLLEWLSIDLALAFFSAAVGQPLNAWGLQRKFVQVTLVGAVVNVALNFILIPRFGVWGAVVTTLLAEGLVGVGCLWVRRRHVRILWWGITAKPLFICFTAALIGRYLASAFPGQWLISAMSVACGILAAFWVSERKGFVALLHRMRGVAESPSGDHDGVAPLTEQSGRSS
jgi:O-antigen/teichoic acid export membrane protein